MALDWRLIDFKLASIQYQIGNGLVLDRLIDLKLASIQYQIGNGLVLDLLIDIRLEWIDIGLTLD